MRKEPAPTVVFRLLENVAIPSSLGEAIDYLATLFDKVVSYIMLKLALTRSHERGSKEQSS